MEDKDIIYIKHVIYNCKLVTLFKPAIEIILSFQLY